MIRNAIYLTLLPKLVFLNKKVMLPWQVRNNIVSKTDVYITSRDIGYCILFQKKFAVKCSVFLPHTLD